MAADGVGLLLAGFVGARWADFVFFARFARPGLPSSSGWGSVRIYVTKYRRKSDQLPFWRRIRTIVELPSHVLLTTCEYISGVMSAFENTENPRSIQKGEMRRNLRNLRIVRGKNNPVPERSFLLITSRITRLTIHGERND